MDPVKQGTRRALLVFSLIAACYLFFLLVAVTSPVLTEIMVLVVELLILPGGLILGILMSLSLEGEARSAYWSVAAIGIALIILTWIGTCSVAVGSIM